MRTIIGCVILFLIASEVNSYPAETKVSYDGFKVYKIAIKSEEQRYFIQHLAKQYNEEVKEVILAINNNFPVIQFWSNS